jgi:outer membrane protein insertion porin family
MFSSVSADISKGLTNSLDDFLKYRCDLHCYVSPLSRLTLACLGRFGYIDPYNATGRVPEDQLFFLGGTADVRGFKENMLRFDVNGDPVGGRSALSASAEARIDLGHDFEFTLFYDIGRVEDTFVPSQGEGLRASVGAGLRYVTAIGPIGFLYGINLDPEDGESGGRVHFAIGYTF